MKLPRFSAFSRCLLGVAAVTTLTFQASAAPFFWETNAAAADWEVGTNWSTDNVAGGAHPATGPVSSTADLVTFTVNSPPNAVTQTVNLKGARSAFGLVTTAQTFTTNIVAGGTASTLTLGTSGIDHNAGGLTLGSSTAGQGVDIRLLDTQTWDSGTSGTGAVAIVAHNNITNVGTNVNDLTLGGINTGSTINGNVTDGAGAATLNIVKMGSGIWTLNGTGNTATIILNEGTLRLTNAGAAIPAKTYVVPGSTLSLRAGGSGFTAAQLDTFRTTVTFDPGGTTRQAFAIDTNNGNFTYDSVLIDGVKHDPDPTKPHLSNRHFDFKKLGNNTLTLTGNNSGFPHSTFVTEGTLALAVPNAAPGPITVETNGTLAAVAGGAGFTVSDIEALIASTTFTGNGSFGISTANGDIVYPSVLSGGIRFNKTGANTLALTANNTYAGATVISGGGSLSIPRIADGGASSPIGASTNSSGNLVLGGGTLIYTGPEATTDRLFSMTTTSTISASGTGPITFGSGSISHSGTASGRTLLLSGINQGANTLPTVITDSNSTNATSVAKTGYGNWTLNGPNTFTGYVRGRGGNLTLDYSANDVNAGNVSVQSGSVIYKAAAGGSSDTIPALQIGEQHNGLGILKLTGGMNLTVTSLVGSSATQRNNLIDLSGNGGSITVTALASTINASNNGLLNNNSSTVSNGRANIILRAQDGSYGFAALAPGATSGPLQKLGNLNVLTPGSVDIAADSTANYLLGAGSYATAGPAVFSTLTLDSTAGPVDLTIAANQSINPSSTGKAILASGTSDISISGGRTNVLAQPTWFHNYLEPSATLNISSNVGKGAYFIIGGSGFTNYTGIGLGARTSGEGGDTQFAQSGGVFRVATDQDLTVASAPGVHRVSEGIFEIGADLNGGEAGDFTRINDASFRVLGSAGFSAYTPTPGGTRVAGFSNTEPLVWGSTNFLSNTQDSSDGDFAFCLSSYRSNATLEFTNNIDLNSRLRAVEVADGSAETDAVLSGVLSGSAVAGLVKTGPGTLSLTGLNTYGGETRAMEGVLKIKAGSIPAGSRLVIGPNGKVSVSGNVGVQSVVINGVEQPAGVVNAPAYITGGGALYVGAAPAGMTYEQWVTNKALQPAEAGELFDADFDGLRNLLEYGLGTEPKVPNGSPITHNAGNSVFRFNRATDRTDISTIIEASETMTGTWSTIATSAGTGPFVLQAGVTGVTIDETTPGTVIVTTSPTGAPAKKFHRVRVTK